MITKCCTNLQAPDYTQPSLRRRSGDLFGHRLGEVCLRASVSGHGRGRLGDGSEGGFLGAMNLAGYLIGVLGGRGWLAPGYGSRARCRHGTREPRLRGLCLGWRPCLAGALATGRWLGRRSPDGACRSRGSGRGCARTARHGRRHRHAGVGGGVIAASLPYLRSCQRDCCGLARLAVLVLALWRLAHPHWPQTPVAAA